MTDDALWLLAYGAAVGMGSLALRRAALARRRRASTSDLLASDLWTSVAELGCWLGLILMLAASGWLPLGAVLLVAGVGLTVLAIHGGRGPGPSPRSR